MNNPETHVKDFAVSQFKKGGHEGYTIRTDRYRYTEWLDLDYREGIKPYSEDIVYDRELYDYKTDPLETKSLIYDDNYQNVLDSMKAFLSNFLIHQFDPPTSVEDKKEKEELPENFGIINYPNPFNPTTTISYSIPKITYPSSFAPSSHEKGLEPTRQVLGEGMLVKLKIFDILGKEVATLVNKIQTPGSYKVTFNAANLSGGVYFYNFSAGNFSKSGKTILLK